MDDVALARVLGAGRVVLGAGLVVAPAALGRPWIGAAADTPGGQVALRGLGVRDVLLGSIALHLAAHGPRAAGPPTPAPSRTASTSARRSRLAARCRRPRPACSRSPARAAAGALLGRRLIAAG